MRFARSTPIIIFSIDRPPSRVMITRPDHAIHAPHRKWTGRQPLHLFTFQLHSFDEDRSEKADRKNRDFALTSQRIAER